MTRMKTLYPSTGRRAKTIDAANSLTRKALRHSTIVANGTPWNRTTCKR
ncbi:hypothetical protein ACVW0A_002056 [Pseudomonas sp. TE3610]